MKLHLRLKHHVMKTYAEQDVEQHAISIGTRGRWVVSRSDLYRPRQRDPCTHWTGDWMGIRAGSEAVLKRITLVPVEN
jgi:hypothetical protein